jgi:hypothetical protein
MSLLSLHPIMRGKNEMSDLFLHKSFVALAASRMAPLLARNVSDLVRGFVTASQRIRRFFNRPSITASFSTVFQTYYNDFFPRCFKFFPDLSLSNTNTADL